MQTQSPFKFVLVWFVSLFVSFWFSLVSHHCPLTLEEIFHTQFVFNLTQKYFCKCSLLFSKPVHAWQRGGEWMNLCLLFSKKTRSVARYMAGLLDNIM